jgi:hypothetical protein
LRSDEKERILTVGTAHLCDEDHILFECEEIYFIEQRSECDLNNLHYQLPNNEDNLVQLFEDPSEGC